jgi:Family of unknown function (DUF6941)
MEVDFALLADGVAQRPDGKIDIFGAAIDTVNTAQVPVMHPQLTLVLRFLISRHEAENEHHVDVILMGDDGTEIARASGEMNASTSEQLDTVPAGRKIGIQIVLVFANLVFPAFGPYQFVIHWDGNEARPPIALHVARLPQAPAA